jgi:acetolactate synthase-1/3 small subunit
MQKRKFTLNLIVNDKPGVLVRVAQVFARRGHNITSLDVHPSDENGHSKMMIESYGQKWVITQIVKQLKKLIDVIEVEVS